MKIGTWMNILALLGGAWVIGAPYLIGYGPQSGNPWSGTILGVDIFGALIVLAALAGLAGFWGTVLKELGERPPEFTED